MYFFPWETDNQPLNSWSPMGTLFSDKPKWVNQLGITLQATARWKAFQHHAADIFRLFQCHTKVAKPQKRICTSWEECKQYVHGVKGVPWRRIWHGDHRGRTAELKIVAPMDASGCVPQLCHPWRSRRDAQLSKSCGRYIICIHSLHLVTRCSMMFLVANVGWTYRGMVIAACPKSLEISSEYAWAYMQINPCTITHLYV